MARNVRVGAHFPWGANLKEVAPFSRAADGIGLDTVWLLDKHTHWGELWTISGIVASNTERIQIGLDATDPYRRNVVVTAHATATLDVLTNGRVIFGIGRGTEELIQAMGIEQKNPVQALRESIEVIYRLLAGEEVTYEGEFVRTNKAQLTVKPVQERIPLVITGGHPEEVALAGEVADGLLMWSGSLQSIRSMRRLAEPHVTKRGLTLEQWGLLPWAPFSVGDDVQAAKEPLKPRLTEVVRRIPPSMLAMIGIDDAQVALIREAWARDNRKEAQDLLTDEMVDKIAIWGSPQRCIERMRELAGEGVKEIMLEFTARWREDFEALRKYILPEL
jgi:5,10-methylenetetrahydromethanopterin reductase